MSTMFDSASVNAMQSPDSASSINPNTSAVYAFTPNVWEARVEIPDTFGGSMYVKWNAATCDPTVANGWDEYIPSSGGYVRMYKEHGLASRVAVYHTAAAAKTSGVDFCIKGWPQ